MGQCFERRSQRAISNDGELASWVRLLHQLHRAQQVLASFLFHESPHEEDALRCPGRSGRREQLAVDPDVMDQKLVRWKASFQRTVANKPGDTQKERSLLAKTFISVGLPSSNRNIGAMKGDHQRHTQGARQRKSCAAAAGEVSMHQVGKGSLCSVVEDGGESASSI